VNGGVNSPFFRRTSETLVSLIWPEGCWIPTGIVNKMGVVEYVVVVEETKEVLSSFIEMT
jgi:hypothetical protein